MRWWVSDTVTSKFPLPQVRLAEIPAMRAADAVKLAFGAEILQEVRRVTGLPVDQSRDHDTQNGKDSSC